MGKGGKEREWEGERKGEEKEKGEGEREREKEERRRAICGLEYGAGEDIWGVEGKVKVKERI